MRIELKNVRQEREGFTASLYIDGRRSGEVSDGRGREYVYSVSDTDWKALLAAAASHAKKNPPPTGVPRAWVDQLLDDLVAESITARVVKRWCSTKTVYRLKGDEKGEYRTVKAKYSPEVAAFLRSKHGDALEEILNESFVRARAR